MVKKDVLTSEQMAERQEQLEMFQRGGDLLILEDEINKVSFKFYEEYRIQSLMK